MDTPANKILPIVVIIGLVIFGIVSLSKHTGKELPDTMRPSDTVSNADDNAIRAQVTEFGLKLKNVSLLMPVNDLKKQLTVEYAKYLTPELLAVWQKDPTKALGRRVSSPWPEKINIVEITKLGEDAYKVEGNVVEVTSTDTSSAGQLVALYPVTFRVEKIGDTWLIAEATQGSYSEVPQKIVVEGVWECLPHKDTSGPQTLECGFGIKADQNGAHYALDLQSLKEYPVNFPTGSRIRVEGTFVPVEQLSSNAWQKYPIKGIISVTKIDTI